MESTGVGVRPSVMLSGFENKLEKNGALKTIVQLGGRYIVDERNSQVGACDWSGIIRM